MELWHYVLVMKINLSLEYDVADEIILALYVRAKEARENAEKLQSEYWKEKAEKAEKALEIMENQTLQSIFG